MPRRQPLQAHLSPNAFGGRRLVDSRYQNLSFPENVKSELEGYECVDALPEDATVASPPTCNDECHACSSHFRPTKWQITDTRYRYGVGYSDNGARKCLEGYITATKHDLVYLKNQLEHCGDTLLKRWQKRSSEKRAALLRKVMPEMYQHKFFEARFLLDQRANALEQYDGMRKCWLLPYLSIEALSLD